MVGFRSSTSRWMGLDVGLKTIGVAVSDPLKLTVRPLTTLVRRSLIADGEEILRLTREQEVDKIVVGKPHHLDGSSSTTLDLIVPLVRHLEEISTLEITWTDERLSTKEAEWLMAEASLTLRERRRRRNEFAAAVILKQHLEESR